MHEIRTIACRSTYPRPNAPSLPGPDTATDGLVLIKFGNHIRYLITREVPKFQIHYAYLSSVVNSEKHVGGGESARVGLTTHILTILNLHRYVNPDER